VYASALELDSRGCDEQQIADELAIDPAAVGPLLRLAEAKLARLLKMNTSAAPPAEPTQMKNYP
jgi:hypothetical protein